MNHHTDQRFQREAHGDVRFSVTTRTAGQRMARNCSAQQGMELQSNADRPLATAGFPGRFGRKAQLCIARHRKSAYCIASQDKQGHGSAIQSNADRSLATGSFPGRFGPTASCRTAVQGIEAQGNAHQSNADCPLATVGFPGRFGSPGRVSSAALSTD